MDIIPTEIQETISKIEQLEAELSELRDKLRLWHDEVRGRLIAIGVEIGEASLAGASPKRPSARSAKPKADGPPGQRDVAIAKINELGRPVNVEELRAELLKAGTPIPPNSLRSHLSVAARTEEIAKVGHGLYAPLGWRDSAQELPVEES